MEVSKDLRLPHGHFSVIRRAIKGLGTERRAFHSMLHGLRIYYVYGATLSLAAIACVLLKMPLYVGALAGALIEYIFDLLILLEARRRS
ncbi:hypothetical protein ACXZ1M_21225 [Duganella sp. PWIR1]